MVGKGSGFVTAHFKISGYSSVKVTQKLVREIVEKFFFRTGSIPVNVHCSYSLVEKSSIWNEPIKGFLSQLLSLLFGLEIFLKRIL
jgi:hypothetical protein